jgi:hypothetical protein
MTPGGILEKLPKGTRKVDFAFDFSVPGVGSERYVYPKSSEFAPSLIGGGNGARPKTSKNPDFSSLLATIVMELKLRVRPFDATLPQSSLHKP